MRANKILMTMILFVSAAASAQSSTDIRTKCFSHHIIEAIQNNWNRRELYGLATDGKSKAVSDFLIGMESAALAGVVVGGADRDALPFQEAGVPVLCEGFVDMSNTPAFAAVGALPWPVLSDFKPADAKKLRQELGAALSKNGLAGVADTAVVEIQNLADQPGFNCMVRHTLESLTRLARLAPAEIARAETLRLSQTPAGLINEVVQWHIDSLEKVAVLDRMAAPLQAEGTPILCRDVPPVPYNL